MTPVILYARVPRFYAEVERAANPALDDRPVIVGGDPRKRGLVQAATRDALAQGVEVGMPVLEALERAPRARALRTDMRLYREVSARLRACFRAVAERMEQAGLDAAYLEPSDRARDPEELARELQDRVAEQLRLPLEVGIAPVKFVALLAAEESGAPGVRRVRPGELAAFLGPLPVSRLPGVGPNTAARLAELSARTVGHLAALDRRVLEERLGNHGLAILARARGEGDARVRGSTRSQSVSQESTLDADELDLAALEERLLELSQRVEKSLALERQAAKRVTLKLRYADGSTTTRSRTVTRAVETAQEIGRLAVELLGRTQAGSRPVRLVGIAVGSLVTSRRDDRQLDLFPSR